jgi:cyclase
MLKGAPAAPTRAIRRVRDARSPTGTSAGIELTPPSTVFDDRLDLDLDGLASSSATSVRRTPSATSSCICRRARGLHRRRALPSVHADRLGGDVRAVDGALDGIVALAPDVRRAGHGPLCGVEGRARCGPISPTSARVARHFDAGRSELEAAKRIDLGPYAAWTEPERLLFNVERAYREFRGCRTTRRSTRSRRFAACTRCDALRVARALTAP